MHYAATAQGLSLNYERLSSLDEPLATEIGDVTFLLNGLLDTPLALALGDGERRRDVDFIGNFQGSALTQLPNRWRVELTYFGQQGPGDIYGSKPDGGYTDNVALSIGGMWGTVVGGNVSGIVREYTRRLRGAGNASLGFDDALGQVADWGGGYIGRFGPWILSTVVDEEANLDMGATYQRPFGTRDYRLAGRYTKRVYTSVVGHRFENRVVGVVGEFIYGSTLYDAGVGYERFTSRGLDADRWYISSGVHTKLGVLGLSLEGHYGRIESKDEVAAALGLQYDVARGLSVNLGFNYAKARADIGNSNFIAPENKEAIISLRYSL